MVHTLRQDEEILGIFNMVHIQEDMVDESRENLEGQVWSVDQIFLRIRFEIHWIPVMEPPCHSAILMDHPEHPSKNEVGNHKINETFSIYRLHAYNCKYISTYILHMHIYIRNHIHMWMWYFFSTFALKTTRFQFVASYPPCQFQANESRQGTRPRGKVWLHRQVVLWALKQERCKVPDRWLPNPSSAIFEKSENPGWKGLWKNTCFLSLLNGFSITY